MPAAAGHGQALAPPYAFGPPPGSGVLRATPEDFQVDEELGFAAAGQGAHVLLRVRKRNANTQWVARELARLAGCRPGDVGYAGLKDRRAVTVQWFSVPRSRAAPDWASVRHAEYEVLEACPHTRKLPRGAHAGNRFCVRVRAADGPLLAAQLAPRLARIAREGVPNYFGAQRFGHAGGNLATPADPGRLPSAQRGFLLSAARSAIFNAVLGQRVAAGTWDRLLAGDLAMLDGRGSIFAVPAPDAALEARCARLEIHPSGPMWGAGEPATAAGVHALECDVAAQLADHAALCAGAGMRQERRALRVGVRELDCEPEPGAVVLRFRLTRGAYATAVLRELVSEPGGEGGEGAAAGTGADAGE